MATLTFVYNDSIAVVGPLSTADEPHSWDLCEPHADRITVPRGWELVRSAGGFAAPAEDQELTALAEAVREVGGARPARRARPSADIDDFDASPGRHRAEPSRLAGPRARTGAPGSGALGNGALGKPRSGRRGHLRVLPDPVD